MWVDPSLIFDHRVSERHIFTLYSSEEERALSMSESGMTDLSQRREREATQREVDKLKESIQTLTR